MINQPNRCELCHDTGPLHMAARCHPTAPLRIEIEGEYLTVFCYVPECNRLVARFKIKEAE